MDFSKIYSLRRTGSDKIPTDTRSGFQRDFDRLIFSSAFRRLQNKTQVFPLPGTAFVHNRLTHSLEVASVGRSLGKIVGEQIASQYKDNNPDCYEFYRYELANVIAAGCLAHDIGNPAFGHSGEKAISSYFTEHADVHVDGEPLKGYFKEKEWKDLSTFEGNANAFRILTHSFRGRFKGGFGLTYTTLASILKYPCESIAIDKTFRHRKKYGFFQSESETIHFLARELHMITESSDPIIYKRHPFVYLVEAADDICYSIIDMEDAHRLGILNTTVVAGAFFHVIESVQGAGPEIDKIWRYYNDLDDKNEAVAYLRAKVINVLTNRSAEIFITNSESILQGNYNETLVDQLNNESSALMEIQKISIEKIYNHDTVIEIEIAGFNVMSELLQLLVPALLKKHPLAKEEKILKLFPYQFREFEQTEVPYYKILNALDFISGMTDEYATEIYRRLKGISIPHHG